MVELAKHIVNGDPGVDTFLFARDDFDIRWREEEVKFKGQVDSQVIQYGVLLPEYQ